MLTKQEATKILNQLIKFEKTPNDLIPELNRVAELNGEHEKLAIVRRSNLIHVLKLYMRGVISKEALILWVDRIVSFDLGLDMITKEPGYGAILFDIFEQIDVGLIPITPIKTNQYIELLEKAEFDPEDFKSMNT